MMPGVYREFIYTIIEKTDNKEVKWEEATENSHVLRTSAATIEVGHYVDHEQETSYYFFKFFNIKNRKEAGFRVGHTEDDFPLMERLFSVASASSTNIDDELSSFLNDL